MTTSSLSAFLGEIGRHKLLTPEQELTLGPAKDGAESSITHLLVCTKAWAVEDALRTVTHRLSSASTVVILCNGRIFFKICNLSSNIRQDEKACVLVFLGDQVKALFCEIYAI